MVHLNSIIRIEIIVSTLSILSLLVVGIAKKKSILSNSGLNSLKANYSKFQKLFYLSMFSMLLFLTIIISEMIELNGNLPFRSVYPNEIQVLKFLLFSSMIIIGLTNFYLVSDVLRTRR